MKHFIEFLRRSQFLGISLLLLLGGACSTTMREDPVAEDYTLGKLDASHWAEIKAEKKGQHFYQSKKWGSMIGLNSVCKRYQESTLETLSKSLTRPLEREQILSQKRISHDDREALETKATGFVDGVPVEALFLIYRKNSCLFDFSLVSKDKILSAEEEDFRKFIKDFRFEGSGK